MKLRFRTNDVDYELEGSAPEVQEYIKGTGRATRVTAVPTKKEKPIAHPTRLPSQQDVAEFIVNMGHPDLEHTMSMVSEHFFGRVLDTRREPNLYNKMFARLIKAQKILQRKAGRKFIGVRIARESGKGGSPMLYSLEPIRQTNVVSGQSPLRRAIPLQEFTKP